MAAQELIASINYFVKRYRYFSHNKDDITLASFLLDAPCKKAAPPCEGFILKFIPNFAPYQEACPCTVLKNSFVGLFTPPILLQQLVRYWDPGIKISTSKNLAWEKKESAHATVHGALALLIKCALVAQHMQPQDFYAPQYQEVYQHYRYLIAVGRVFANPEIKLLFWSDIRGRPYLYNFVCTTVILCLESTIFQLRSNANRELEDFEQFIVALSNADCRLVVFSEQSLFNHAKHNPFKNSYNFTVQADYLKQSTSIQSALEPGQQISAGLQDKDILNSGAFDRLLDLLAQGQVFLNTIAVEYGKLAGSLNLSAKDA